MESLNDEKPFSSGVHPSSPTKRPLPFGRGDLKPRPPGQLRKRLRRLRRCWCESWREIKSPPGFKMGRWKSMAKVWGSVSCHCQHNGLGEYHHDLAQDSHHPNGVLAILLMGGEPPGKGEARSTASSWVCLGTQFWMEMCSALR